MKKLICTLLLWISLATLAHAQTTYQLYVRLTESSGPITGPISSLPGVTGGDFFALGCTEHQFSRAAGSGSPDHDPYLLTRAFDPGSSPYLRQRMNLSSIFTTVEVYMVEDNGSTTQTIFGTRLEDAIITKITTAADANALQETLSFEYARIFWIDVQANRTWGWDIVNNRSL